MGSYCIHVSNFRITEANSGNFGGGNKLKIIFTTLIFLVLFVFFSLVSRTDHFKYKDPKQPPTVRINDLLNRMTLAEKIGQMAQIERAVATTDVMKNYFIGMNCKIFDQWFSPMHYVLLYKKYHLKFSFRKFQLTGSVLSGGGSVPKKKAKPQDWVDMINKFQNGSLSTRLRIPMIYGIDAVHGNNNLYNATIFPHNIGLGVTR